MNHGGIGILEHIRGMGGLRFLFKDDILQTLSIGDKSTLEGVYYPGREDHEKTPSTIDFVLSPIPYRLWPKVGRIRVRLLSESNSIAEFSQFLANNGVSILHSEYSRSGYRFATWNFVVSFDVDIRDSDFDYNETAYKPILDALETIRNKILTNISHLLFHDKDDVRFRDYLDMWPITPLAYFYNNSRQCKNREQDPWIFEEFNVESTSNKILVSGESRFTSILANKNSTEQKPKLNVYADISTTDVMLRIAIIPSREEWRFSILNVEYVRNSPPDTSRGFCAHIINSIPSDFKIWKLTNFTKINSGFSEIGGASMLLEDMRQRPGDLNEREGCYKDILMSIRENSFSVSDGKPFSLEARQQRLDSNRLWDSLIREDARYEPPRIKWDIFLSYSERDTDVADMMFKELAAKDLTCFMARKELRGKGGVNFSDYIRDSITASRGMVLLCSKNSIKREWVISEWSAAWVMKKRITPVLYQVASADLPLRLQTLQCVDVHNFSDFVEELVLEKQSMW